jgi:hypothetical protein
MDPAKPGEIKQHCDPNGLSTFLEYLIDHASPETRAVGEPTIADALAGMDDWPHERAVQLMDKVQVDRVADVGCPHRVRARKQKLERRGIPLAKPPGDRAVVERVKPERQQLHRFLDGVGGRPGDLGHDRHVLPGDRVQERRLADVAPAEDADVQAQ